jgi:Na+/H+ antiporter
MLAVGLVLVTTAAVALAVHLVVPAKPWSVAFVLGAIISPTDELAATPVLERFRLPRHLVATIGGESLLNDATALVIYAAAIVAAGSGAFSIGSALMQFALTVVGSMFIGYCAGRIAVALWTHIKDRQLQSVISVTLPFLAYFPAAHIALSGVLAVVTAGTYANHFTPKVMTAASRTQIVGYWNTVVFVVNAVLFLVVGLQLHDVATAAFASESWQLVVGYALLVNVIVIAVRLLFVALVEPNWKHALIVGWSGLRGAVSLAAALAIPLATSSGAEFPHRDLVIFITFSVILVTLVGGGLTLPTIVRRLRVEGGNEERDELRHALVRGSEVALVRIDELERAGSIDAVHADMLRRQFEHARDANTSAVGEDQWTEHARHAAAETEIIAAQRKAFIDMRARGEIDNVVLRRVQSTLDLMASRLAVTAEEGP